MLTLAASKKHSKLVIASLKNFLKATLTLNSSLNYLTLKKKIEVVTYIAGEGDISTDLLSPGHQAHSRADRELHGKCMITPEAQEEIQALQAKHPQAKVMLIAEKGTMGVGSSRMSGVNNVALWAGKQASPYVPFINIAPVVAGTNGIAPIFLTTVDVTGGIGLDLKNWVKKVDASGNAVVDENGDVVLEEAYSVATGTVLTIDTKAKKLFNGSEVASGYLFSIYATKNGIYESGWFLRGNFR